MRATRFRRLEYAIVNRVDGIETRSIVSGFGYGKLAYRRERYGWVITHLPTGLVVAILSSRRLARKTLLSLVYFDWNFRSPKSRKVKRMKNDILAIIEKIKS